MSIRLSDDEVWRFVDNATVCVFVTIRSNGMPIAMPMWLVVVERLIYLRAHPVSKTVARIARDPRAALLVHSGEHWSELKAVHFAGMAKFEERDSVIQRVLTTFRAKYQRLSTSFESVPEATQRHYTPNRAIIRFEPADRVLSWDNSKLTRRQS